MWTLILLVVLGALAALATVRVVNAVEEIEEASIEAPFGQCLQQTQLMAFERDGWPWEQHRQSLQAEVAFTQSSPHYVVDQSSGRAYTWLFASMTAAGRARFAVPTRWTWLDPDWKERPWLLLYDCET